MPYLRKQSIVFSSCSFLIFLSGCSAKPECDSFESRDAVLKAVSDDHNNALGKYAAENSTTAKPSNTNSESEKAKQQPLYLLGEKIVTTSTSKDKQTLKCSGSISVTVGDTKASKEIDFTVQQLSDGKISVSISPFQFDRRPISSWINRGTVTMRPGQAMRRLVETGLKGKSETRDKTLGDDPLLDGLI
jgi:hypothetical protein